MPQDPDLIRASWEEQRSGVETSSQQPLQMQPADVAVPSREEGRSLRDSSSSPAAFTLVEGKESQAVHCSRHPSPWEALPDIALLY